MFSNFATDRVRPSTGARRAGRARMRPGAAPRRPTRPSASRSATRSRSGRARAIASPTVFADLYASLQAHQRREWAVRCQPVLLGVSVAFACRPTRRGGVRRHRRPELRGRFALVAVLLALAAAVRRDPSQNPRVLPRLPPHRPSALPARVAAGRWSVDFRLTTSAPSSRARRVFGGAWRTAALAPDGRLPADHRPATAGCPTSGRDAALQPLAVPALDVRRAADGLSLALGVRVGNLPPAEPIWRARLTTLLFFGRSCTPACRHRRDRRQAIDLDAAAFSPVAGSARPAVSPRQGQSPRAGRRRPRPRPSCGVVEVPTPPQLRGMSVDAVFGSAPAI